MTHPVDPLISAWLLDDLDADGVQALETALRNDASARARFAHFCQSEVVLPQALGFAATRPATTGFRRAVRGGSRRMRLRRPDGRMNWVLPVAAAALVAVIVAVSVIGRAPPAATPTMAAPAPAPAPGGAPDQGPIELLRSDGDVRYAGNPMTNGMQAPRGAVIEVVRGTADLRWRSDGSLLTLAAGSAVRIDDGVASVHLKTGRLEARITQQTSTPFTISAPHASAAVMGTRFTMQVTEETTDLKVDDGRVRFTAVADRMAIELIANESMRADQNGLQLPGTQRVRAFVPTGLDITRDIGGPMIGRGTMRLDDLTKGGFNLRIECSDGVRSVFITMHGIESRLEQVPAFHLFGDVKERATRKWNPRPGTFSIEAKPFADVEGRQALGPPVTFELTIVP